MAQREPFPDRLPGPAQTIAVRRADQRTQAGSGGIDIGDLLQNLAQSRRSGRLELTEQDGRIALHLRHGTIVGVEGAPGGLAAALAWFGAAPAAPGTAAVGRDDDDGDLARRVLADGGADRALIARIAQALVVEAVTAVMGWSRVEPVFADDLKPAGWPAIQADCGCAVAVTGVLMEAMRRHDDLRAVAESIPDRSDLVVATGAPAVLPPDLAPAGEALVAALAGGPLPLAAAVRAARLPPWEGRVATAHLIRAGALRVAAPAEALAEAFRQTGLGQFAQAELIAGRAAARGADRARSAALRARIALLRRLGDDAARHALDAYAAGLDTVESVELLQEAAALGDAGLRCLEPLWRILEQQGRAGEAVPVLLALAARSEETGDGAAALEALAQARRLGADPVATGSASARILALAGDRAQAALHLDQAATAAEAAGRGADAARVRGLLLDLDPRRADVALALATAARDRGASAEALALARRGLAAEPAEDVALPLRELVGVLDPGDTVNGQALAAIYQHRADRHSATQQLRRVLAQHEAAGDLTAQLATLERMLDLGGAQAETRARMAEVLGRLGHERAGTAWAEAVTAAQDAGDRALARDLIDRALAARPGDARLHRVAAESAFAGGDPAAAREHLRRAAALLRGAGDPHGALAILHDLRRQAPDDLAVHLDLVALALQVGQLDRQGAASALATPLGTPEPAAPAAPAAPDGGSLSGQYRMPDLAPGGGTPLERRQEPGADAELRRLAEALRQELAETRLRLEEERTRFRHLRDQAEARRGTAGTTAADGRLLGACVSRLAAVVERLSRERDDTVDQLRDLSRRIGRG
jgi:hypothetical protein